MSCQWLPPFDADLKNHLIGGTARITFALVALTYTFDVLRLVPSIQTGIGVVNFGGTAVKSATAFGAEFGPGRRLPGDPPLVRRRRAAGWPDASKCIRTMSAPEE